MKRVALVLASVLLASCGSSRSKDELPSTIPPPQIQTQSSTPSTDARLAELQTSMTELLERLDVLNARVAKLENLSATPPNNSGAPSPTAAKGAAEGRGAPPVLQNAHIADEYRRAITLFSQGKHADARAAFQKVFDADPAGELADNALFWIGETYFVAANYPEAMRYYSRVAKDFADQNKAPDAVFRMGMTYEKTGDLGMARRTFEECIQKYPYSSPAAAARMELKKIKY
jgi:tol-pal system protein YbgF